MRRRRNKFRSEKQTTPWSVIVDWSLMIDDPRPLSPSPGPNLGLRGKYKTHLMFCSLWWISIGIPRFGPHFQRHRWPPPSYVLDKYPSAMAWVPFSIVRCDGDSTLRTHTYTRKHTQDVTQPFASSSYPRWAPFVPRVPKRQCCAPSYACRGTSVSAGRRNTFLIDSTCPFSFSRVDALIIQEWKTPFAWDIFRGLASVHIRACYDTGTYTSISYWMKQRWLLVRVLHVHTHTHICSCLWYAHGVYWWRMVLWRHLLFACLFPSIIHIVFKMSYILIWTTLWWFETHIPWMDVMRWCT